MTPELVKELLDKDLPDCDIAVEGGDGKYLVTASGPAFDGLNAVKRQQRIYSVLNEHIASGAIHAVSMKLSGSDEGQAG